MVDQPSADRVPYKSDPSPDEASKTTIQTPSNYNAGMGFMDDINYHKMANFFDLSFDERKDARTAQKLSYLTDWAVNRIKNGNQVEVMTELKKLSRTLGETNRGNSLIKKLYEFARLDSQKRSLEQEMKLYKEEPVGGKKQVPQAKKPTKTSPVNQKVIQTQIKKKMEGVTKQIKSTVQTQVQQTINQGIKEALSNFLPK